MTRQDIIRKLSSRKFWAALATFVSNIVIAVGVSQTTAERITCIILAFGAMVVYILAEGAVDAANKPTSGADEHVEPPPDAAQAGVEGERHD